jgi:hypothetical protein
VKLARVTSSNMVKTASIASTIAHRIMVREGFAQKFIEMLTFQMQGPYDHHLALARASLIEPLCRVKETSDNIFSPAVYSLSRYVILSTRFLYKNHKRRHKYGKI